ncbi:hypothetical protein EUGRSUZ_I01656 [Eucalyptus grandis]|uniref:Uncharacterized protein n=2 Tax=Eucalyptus grandis TaxID=71139 RepID=A0A059APD7_EUCGR|nr:hypothetical protein EUGRSUZ_I01656 [Eucalyptus grandis]
MGSCVSAHRSTSSAAAIPPSPIKAKAVGGGDVPIGGGFLKSQWSPGPRSTSSFRDYGSKEDVFFDSKPWLESDCEDDFFSVNGDFTPSRGSTPSHGNTPIHPSLFKGSQLVKNAPRDKAPVPVPEHSPTSKKKKLADLFRDSLGGQEDVANYDALADKATEEAKAEAKPTILDVLPSSDQGTPYISKTTSLCSGERTPNGDYVMEKQKPVRTTTCCLPRLSSRGGFSERSKKMSSAIAVHD